MSDGNVGVVTRGDGPVVEVEGLDVGDGPLDDGQSPRGGQRDGGVVAGIVGGRDRGAAAGAGSVRASPAGRRRSRCRAHRNR